MVRSGLFCALLLLSSCQLPPSPDPDVSAFMLAKRDNQPVFKAIQLDVKGFDTGELFKQQYEFYPQIVQKFRRSGLFNSIEGEHKQRIEVHWECWKKDRDLPDIKAGSSRSKWSMVESNVELYHRMEALVIEDGLIAKRYEYTNLVDYRGGDYLDNANRYLSWFHHGVNSMLSSFFLDLKKDGILSL